MSFKPKQKQFEKPPAIMYRNKTKSGDVMFNLILNTEKLPAPNEKGEIVLTGFVNTFKKSESQPDVNFRLPREQQGPKKTTVKQKDAPTSDSDAGGEDWF